MVSMPTARSISLLSICLTNMVSRRCVLTGLIAICMLLCLQHTAGAEPGHPCEVVVNGKAYHWPRVPVVVIVIDGGDPAYVNAALEVGLLPNFKKLMSEGFVSVAQSVMPSFTNPNNISIITGVFPEVHGISGNFFLNPANGESEMMNDPKFLRADSILAKFSENGAKVAAISAKDKLAKMLRYRLVNGISFSAEKADKCTKAENGLDDCLSFVGLPLPNVYSADLSLFVLKAGIKIFRNRKTRPHVFVTVGLHSA